MVLLVGISSQNESPTTQYGKSDLEVSVPSHVVDLSALIPSEHAHHMCDTEQLFRLKHDLGENCLRWKGG